MSDVYRLVFRGEVLEGQHPAVVRKRLARSADFDEATLDRLFSGRPVVLKREADTATAARLQVMFRKAGARLRVLPVEEQDSAVMEHPTTGSSRAGRAAPSLPAEPAGALSEFELLPPGSDVLRQDERQPWARREIDTSGLELAKAAVHPRDEQPSPTRPAIPELTVAQAGARLGPKRAQPDDPVQAPDFDLAAVGVDLGRRAAFPPTPAVGEVAFELAPVGATLDQHPAVDVPTAPDTSHLKLTREER